MNHFYKEGSMNISIPKLNNILKLCMRGQTRFSKEVVVLQIKLKLKLSIIFKNRVCLNLSTTANHRWLPHTEATWLMTGGPGHTLHTHKHTCTR